jgi:hypothetical protein
MGKHFDHFLKYTPLTTYESFIEEVTKGDELRNRYFYDSIKWGEKYRHDKNKRQLKYLKNRRDKEAKAKKAAIEATKNPIAPVSTEGKAITLYQGDPKRRGSTLSIGENTILPKSVVPIRPPAVLNIIKNTYPSIQDNRNA